MAEGKGRWRYYPDDAAWYFYVDENAEPPPWDHQEEFRGMVIIDRDKNGRVAGIEIIGLENGE